MTVQLTQDNIVMLILICFVIGFLGAEKVLGALVKLSGDPLAQATNATPTQMCKFSRIVAASLIMRWASILLKVASGLALAIGFFKSLGTLASLALPDRTLGFAILISYCGLAAVFGVIAEDLRAACKKLFEN
jgi:hypothetical protein